MKKINLSVKIGLILAAAHFSYFIFCLAKVGFLPWVDGQEGSVFAYFFILDIFLLPLMSFLDYYCGHYLIIVFCFGFLGTLCWLCIPVLIGKFFGFLRGLNRAKNGGNC